MKARDIVLAVIVVVLLLVLFQRLRNSEGEPELADSDVPIENIEQNLEGILGREISDTANKTEMEAVGGFEGLGIVTWEGEENVESMEILADLPDPEGKSYQAWTRKDGELQSLGVLMSVKGGWLLNYSPLNSEEIMEVVVSLEEMVDDTIEEEVLRTTL